MIKKLKMEFIEKLDNIDAREGLFLMIPPATIIGLEVPRQ